MKQKTLSKQAEKSLESLYETMSRLMASPPPNLPGMANRIAVNTERLRDVLFRMGLQCDCQAYKVRGLPGSKYKCGCRAISASVRRYRYVR